MSRERATAPRFVPVLAAIGAVLAALIAFPSLARACKCSDGATKIAPLRLRADSSEVRVDSAFIDIVCDDPALSECTVVVRENIDNLSDRPVAVRGSVGEWAVGAEVTVGDQHRDELAFWVTEDLRRRPADAIEFSVAAHTRVQVTVEAPLAFGRFDCGCFASGLRRRHPIVSRSTAPRAHRLTILADGGLPRAADANVFLSVEYPGPARISSSFADQRRRLRTRRIGGGRLRTSGSFAGVTIALFVERKALFVRGGPFVAVGGGWGSDRAVRLRAGWELAAPRWLVYALAAESDTTDLRVVPTIQAMSGHGIFPLLPAAAIGLGAPVRAFPQSRIGLRAQADLSWYFVALVAALDWYPGRQRQPLMGSLMVQLSL